MTFRKTSLRSRRRKKGLFGFAKKAGAFGFLALGVLALLPGKIVYIFRPKKEKKASLRRLFYAFFFAIFALSVAFFWTEFGRETGKTLVKNTIFAFGAELPKDKKGFFNVLLLGSGGGEMHAAKGHKLTDSIIIASIDLSGKSVAMLSVPRDFYIETDHVYGRINEIVRDESKYFLKDIRQLPQNKTKLAELSGTKKKEFQWELEVQADEMAREILKDKIEEIFKISIHRTAQIDFRGFEKFIDAIGGVDVYVDKTINDPTYPDYEWGYDPFLLKKGQQHFDGRTALKYARSRHDSSDFDRAKRQQKLLSSMKERMTSLNVLTSPTKIRNVLDVINEYYKSDISFDEMITLAKFADSLDRNNILSYVLNDDPSQTGGFLVTPDRELYGGAFVLVPFLNLEKDKYAQIHAFLEVVFWKRGIATTGVMPITILNGTNRQGVAGGLMVQLERFGWHIADVGNAEENIKETTIYTPNTPKGRQTAELLASFFDTRIEVKQKAPGEDAPDTIEIILGSDYRVPYRIPEISPPSS